MFRHKNNSPTSALVIPTTHSLRSVQAPEESLSGRFEGEQDRDPSSAKASLGMTNKTSTTDTAKLEPSLKELMEKNLKWSQIIYEQNRKINHKLLWTALASWIRLLILVGSIVAAVVFLPPLLKGVWSQYSSLFNGLSAGMGVKNPLDNVMKLFNLDPAQLEQLKTLLK